MINKINLLGAYAMATESEKNAGLAWYREARADVLHLSTEYHIDWDVCAGVVAALSPNCPWSQNISSARALIHQSIQGVRPEKMRNVVAYTANRLKALAILEGEDPEVVLGGPKTLNFFRNLAGCDDSVTIDGHAYNLWRNASKGVKGAAMTPKLYDVVARDYRDGAGSVGVKPLEFQAILWIVWRRLQNITV